MSLRGAILLLRKIRDHGLSFDSLSPDEREIAECLLQGGFVTITEDGKLRLTTHGAEIVSLNDELESLEKRENLEDIARELIADIKHEIEDEDYSNAMFNLFILFYVIDALMWKKGRILTRGRLLTL